MQSKEPNIRIKQKKEDQNIQKVSLNEKEQENLEELYKKYKKIAQDQDIQLLKSQFNNKILLNQIYKEDKQKNKNKIFYQKPMIPTSEDVELNYNTKQHYVDHLHHQIKGLKEQLRNTSYSKQVQDKILMKMQYDDLKEEYRKLKDKYKKMIKKYKKLKKYKKNYREIFPKAVQMRKILKEFYETNNMNYDELLQLNLDSPDMLLDTDLDKINISEDEDDDYDDSPKNIQQYKMEIKLLRKQTKDLRQKFQGQLSKLKAENDSSGMSVQAKINDRTQQIEKIFEEKNQKFIDEITKLKNEREDLIHNQQKRIKEYEQKMDTLNESINSYDQKLRQYQKEVQYLYNKYQRLDNKHKKIIKDNNMSVSKLMMSQLKTSQLGNILEKSLTTFRQKLGVKELIENKNSKKVVELDINLLEQIKGELDKMEKMQDQLDLALQQQDKLQIQNSKLMADQEKLDQKIDQTLKDKNDALTESKILKHKNDTQSKKLSKLQNNFQELNEKLSSKNKEVISIFEKIYKKDTKLKGQSVILEQTYGDQKSLLQQIAKLKEHIKKLEKKLRDLNISFQELQDDFLSQSRLLNATESEIENYRKNRLKNNLLESNIDKFKDEISILELKNSKLMAEIDQKKFDLNKTMKELYILKAEFQELKNVLDDKNENNKLKFQSIQNNTNRVKKNKEEENLKLQKKVEEQDGKIIEFLKDIELKEKEIEEKIKQIKAQKEIEQQFIIEKEQNQLIIQDLQKYKKTLDDMKQGQGDYIKIKLENEELQTSLKQLQELTQNNEHKIKQLTEKSERLLNKNEENEIEIKRLSGENTIILKEKQSLDMDMLKKLQEIQEFQNQSKSMKDQIEQEKENTKEKQKQIQELKNMIYKNDTNLDPEESLQIQIQSKENERLLEKNEEQEKYSMKFKQEIFEKEQQIQQLNEKLEEILKNGQDVDILKDKIMMRDLQILDMVEDSNRKTEKIQDLLKDIKKLEIELLKAQQQLQIKHLANSKMKEIISKIYDEFGIKVKKLNEFYEINKLYRILNDFKNAQLEVELKQSEGNQLQAENSPLVTSLKQKIEDQNQEINNQIIDYQMLMNQNQTLRLKIEKLEANSSDFEYKITRKNEELVNSKQKIEELKYNLEQNSKGILYQKQQNEERYLKQIDNLKLYSEQINLEQLDLQKQINELTLSLQKSKKIIEEQEDEIKQKTIKVQELNSEINNLEEELINEKSNFIEITEQYKNQNQDLEYQILNDKKLILDKEREVQFIQRKIQKFDETKARLNDRIKSLVKNMQILGRSNPEQLKFIQKEQELQDQIENLIKENFQLKEQNLQLQQQNEILNQSDQQQNSSLQQEENNLIMNHDENEDLQQKIQRLARENKKFKEQNQKLRENQSQKFKEQTNIDDNQQKIQNLQNEISLQRKNLIEKNSQISRLETTLNDCSQSFNKQQQFNNNLIQQKQNLQKKIEILSSQNNEIIKESDELENQMQKLIEEINQFSENINLLQQKINLNKNIIIEKDQQIENLRKEISELKN